MSPVGGPGRVPPVELFPERWHSEPMVALLAMHAGEAEEGERVLRPLRDLEGAIADLSARMPYTEVQRVLDEDYPDGWRYYWKSQNISGLNEEVIEHPERVMNRGIDHGHVDRGPHYQLAETAR